jgi:GT2 family glycosyltransferase
MGVDVSIIIVNLNDRELLEPCLASIYEHTHGVSFEVIVVDNHSSDDSVAMITTRFPQVRLIENPQNNRYAIANNQGLEIATGRYIFYLNGDTRLLGNAVKELADFLDQHIEAGAVGCQLVYPDGSHQDACFRFPSALNLLYLLCFARFYWKTPLAGNYLFNGATTPQPVDFLIGACLMARHEVLTVCHGMDSDYYFYGEDSDLCYRIRQHGWPIYHLPQSTKIIHYGGVSSTVNLFDNNQRQKYLRGWQSRFLFVRKHYSWPRRQLVLLASIMALGVNGVLYGIAGIKRRSWAYARDNLCVFVDIAREAFRIVNR